MTEFIDAIKAIKWENKNKPLFKFEDIDGILPHYKYSYLPNCHLGQRKLLLCEIIFYNKVMDDCKKEGIDPKSVVIIYSGSAPGIHTPLILDLYPFNFVLVDPNYHQMTYDYHYIYKNDSVVSKSNKKMFHQQMGKKHMKTFFDGQSHNVFDNNSYGSIKTFKATEAFKERRVWVIQDYMTPELSVKLNGLLRDYTVHHVSDIRSNMFHDERPMDADILLNSALQILICKALKPRLSYIKFVVPKYPSSEEEEGYIAKIKGNPYFKECGCDFIGDYKKGAFPFFKGELFLQPWAGPISTEMRVLFATPTIMKYDSLKTRQKMIYYNVYRAFVPVIAEKHKGYDFCNDCAIEVTLLKQLVTKDRSLEMLKESIDKVTGYNLTSRKCKHHGELFKYNGIHFDFDVQYKRYSVDHPNKK